MIERLDIISGHGFAPPVSTWLFGAASTLFAVGVALQAGRWVAHRRRLEALRSRVNAPPPTELVEGAITLAGAVTVDSPAAPVVAVSIVQECSDTRAPRPRVEWWKEITREVEARPFTLEVHGSRLAIRVLPGKQPLLFASARQARSERQDGTLERRWDATLNDGEHVAVTGVLTRDHDSEAGAGRRDRAPRFTLSAATGERLQIECASAADEIVRGRARSRPQRLLLLLAVGLYAASIGSHLYRSRHTTIVTAEVVALYSRIPYTRPGQHRASENVLDARCEASAGGDGHAPRQFTGLAWEYAGHFARPLVIGDSVAIVFPSGSPEKANLGTTLVANFPELLCLVLGLLLLGLSRPWANGASRPLAWFERERLDTTPSVD